MAEVFDGVALLDEDIQAATGVAFVLGEDAGELGEGAGAGVAQGNEGFFLALSQIGQSQDGLFLKESAEIGLAFPLGGVDKSGMESSDGIFAFLEAALYADSEQEPGAIQMIEMGSRDALKEGEDHF